MKVEELLYIDDFPQVVALIRKHVAEADPDDEFDEKETLQSLFAITNDLKRTEQNAWLVWDGGLIVGYALAHISKNPYNTQTEAMLRYHYVEPKSRVSTAAFQLLHTFQNWAKLTGASRITLGAGRIDPEIADRINKMYERRGFKRIGAMYQQHLRGH